MVYMLDVGRLCAVYISINVGEIFFVSFSDLGAFAGRWFSPFAGYESIVDVISQFVAELFKSRQYNGSLLMLLQLLI